MIRGSVPPRFRGTGAATVCLMLSLAIVLTFRIEPALSQEKLHGTNAFNSRDIADTGESKAQVTANPEKPEAISGFVYIPIIKGQYATGQSADEDFARDLTYTMKQYTRIEVKRDGMIALDSPKLQKYPVIFILGTARYNDAEAQNLRNYLSSGNFAFLVASGSWFWKEFYSKFARIEAIPEDHPFYSALFKDMKSADAPMRPRGIWIGKKLVGVDVGGFKETISPSSSDDRYRKLLASFMVYALTR